jgi:hypothetical protein
VTLQLENIHFYLKYSFSHLYIFSIHLIILHIKVITQAIRQGLYCKQLWMHGRITCQKNPIDKFITPLLVSFISQKWKLIYKLIAAVHNVCLIGFYFTWKQFRSYGDLPALLVEEDLRFPAMHYFRHKRAPEYNH